MPSWTSASNVEELSSFLIKKEFTIKNNSGAIIPKNGSNKFLKFAGVFLGIIFVLYIGRIFIVSNNSGNNEINENTSVSSEQDENNQINTNSNSQVENTQNTEDIERKRKAEEFEKTQRNLRNNWSRYINVQSSDYKYREMGGIFDLYLTVYNNTDYRLDAGRVHIDIIKANGEIFTTNTLDFTNVDAHNSVVLRVPDCERGTSIGTPEFDGLFAKDFNFCYEASRPYNPSDENDYNKCQN